jgi:Bifunctional DNA primase/polymerase, N-terminal/Primase C terminal 2 (PriCT-2)
VSNNTSPTASNSQKLDLRTAVRAAIRAYEKSGKMLDAALAYATHGFPVFPLTINKTPVPKRDQDAKGEPIPGTGGFKKATTDPEQIHKWWDKNEYLIGLPMGAASGVWCLDIDTSEDHADGVAEWEKIAAQHDPIITREHRSATGGPHLIFNWSEADRPIRCSSGDLPDGISVKGEGGYIAVPPSVRKQRAYTVYRDVDPIDAPKWLISLILPNPFNRPVYTLRVPEDGVDLEELADAMKFVPNDDLSWQEWTSHGLALFAASGGSEEGFKLFDEWSARSAKYEGDFRKYGYGYTQQRWEEIKGSPPDRTGAGKIFKIAWENGWRWNPKHARATYPQQDTVSSSAARERMHEIMFQFLLEDVFPHIDSKQDPQLTQEYRSELPQVVKAVRADVGTGKTKIVIEELADGIKYRKRKQRSLPGPIIYAVDRHRLSKRIEEQFAEHGIDARIFYGRMHIDPVHRDPSKRDDEQVLMCRNVEAVTMAMSYHASISSTCCSDGEHECLFKDRCGYYRQQPEDGDQPDVWIIAHDLLFYAQDALGEPVAVIIDESFWQKGIRGLELESKWSIAIDSISNCSEPPKDFATLKALGIDAFELGQLRFQLAQALRRQDDDGGVERRHLAEWRPEKCGRALRLEWSLMPKFDQYPGISQEQLSKLLREKGDVLDEIRHRRRMIKVWEAVRDLLAGDIEVSGRLTLKQENGQRCVAWRGSENIKQQFKVPTLIMDATLPSENILRVYYPDVKLVGDIKVALASSVHVRQVLDAPTSSNKLDDEKHLHEMRRYILQRWYECDRQSTLVICQEKVERWLRWEGKLPEAIELAHYNDIAGLDEFKDVRLLILIGRTQPGPAAPEMLTAALTGRQPPEIKGSGSKGFAWYRKTKRGIRLADGSTVAVIGDRHPDPFVESVRWQICEAQLVQAIGRGRAIHRDASTPLDIDLLLDTCLPITVNEVVHWKRPSLLIETANADAVMLASPRALMEFRPEVWPNRSMADRTLRQGVPSLPGFVEVAYQPKKPKVKQRTGWFDLSRIPDPHAWIANHLGG